MRQLTRASLVVGLFAWLAGACGARTGDESLDDGFGGSHVGGTGFGGTGTGAAGHPGGGGIVSGGSAGFGAGGGGFGGVAAGGFGGVAAGGFGGVAAGGFGGVAAGGFGGIPPGGAGGFGAGGGGFGGVAAGGFGGVGAIGGAGGGPSGPCCVPHGSPGCFDPKITACVCQTDQYCCQQQWDSLCVNEVTSLGCGNCGGTGGAGGFGGFGGGGFGGVGNFGGGGSGGSGGAVICGGSFCSDVSAPGGFTLSACCPPTSPFSCGLDTTSLPSLVPLPDGCLPKNQPGVPDPSCPNDSIAGFPLAGCCKPNGMCGNDYSVIQLGCVDTSQSGGPPATKCGGTGPFTGSCCEAHSWAGCGDPGVVSCVCSQDSFCCNGNWDSVCVGEVTSLGCGSCGGTGGGGGSGGGPACNPSFCPIPLPGGQPCCVTGNGPCGVLTPQGCVPFGFPSPPNP